MKWHTPHIVQASRAITYEHEDKSEGRPRREAAPGFAFQQSQNDSSVIPTSSGNTLGPLLLWKSPKG